MKTIVLCVDRDDDLGRNAGIRGPVLGVDRNIDAANRLAMRDPEDTDVNALFGAVKLAKELRTDVATLTGDGNVGLVSDKKISRQLDKVIKKWNPDLVILVTDGLDDEQVIPIIQSRVKIDGVRTITVRQSKELEKAYFKATHFLREVTDDPNLARLLFGIPGIALILLAVGGVHALSLILALIGGYLLLRGFGWEDEFFDHVNGFIRDLSVDRISTLIYFIAFVMLVVSLSYGYGDYQSYSVSVNNPKSMLNALALIILNGRSFGYFISAVCTAVTAKTIDDWSRKRYIKVRRFLILIGFIVLVYFIMTSGASFLVEESYVFGSFVLTSVTGVILFAFWTQVIDLWFRDEIDLINDLLEKTRGMKVFTPDGVQLGNVSKVYVEDLDLKAVRVGRKKYFADDIVSVDNVVVVNP